MSKAQEWIDRGLTHVAKTYGRYPLVADCRARLCR